MRHISLLGSLAILVLAGGILSACKDKSASTPAATSSGSDATAKAVAWPGKGDANLGVSADLTQANYMIVYDGSGSMGDASCGGSKQSKHSEGLVAVKEFVNAIPNDANVGLYVFDGSSDGVRVALGGGNKSKVVAGLDNVRIGSGTPLGKAVDKSYSSLTIQGQKQLGYGRYSMVIVTDGAASDSSFLDKMIDYVTVNTPIEIHTIGFCLGSKHTLNQPGKTFYASAQSRTDLLNGLKGVLAEAENVTADDFK